MKRGIVIGKFYPPHKGHQYLMETALRHVDELTVLVCHKEDQKIPGALRAAWIKEIMPACRVLLLEDRLPEDDSKAWAKYTLETLGYVPDIVFTSEDYGDRYARLMGSAHISVDRAREHVPICSTKVRENTYACWQFLPPCVKAYYAKRIVVIGAESTGTTTLALALAEHYNTVCVPEFGRVYTERHNKVFSGLWQTNDFIEIAKEQNKLEDSYARRCNKILICDTDSFGTALWHERYMGFMSSEVEALSLGRNYSLYILTGIDIPFAQDGLRDGEHIRANMHHRFLEELVKRQKPHIVVSGSPETRLKIAIENCNAI